MEDFHTYYVGENGVWVHNSNCKLIKNDDGTYDAELSYKEDWTPGQRAEADAKCKALSKADTAKTIPERGSTSASKKYKNEYGESKLLRLSDFLNIRKNDNISEKYLKGVFGAIPKFK